MAVSNPTLIGSGQSPANTGGGAYTTPSQTIPSNCFLIVTIGVQGFDTSGSLGPALTCSPSLGGISLVPAVARVGNAASWSTGLATWYANVTTGGSSTFTIDCGSNNIWSYNWSVAYLTGHNASPIGSASAADTDIPGGYALGSAPAATSVIYSAYCTESDGSNTTDPGSGWTELMEEISPDGVTCLQVQYRPPGSTATSILYSNQIFPSKAVAHAFEILEAGGGGGEPGVFFGATALSAIKLGTTDVTAAYLGTTQVWPSA